MLKKTFWSQLFTPTPTTGKEKYSATELRNLYDVLQRNALVTDLNRALVVETIRSVAEFIIWGDQNEPKVFDFFLENNIMLYLHTVLLQSPANRSGEVAKQVLQTLSIIIQNVRSETGIFFLFSNNHINNIVEVRFDFDDEEVLGYYISFLKTISLKLNKRTVQFFFDLKAGMTTFPLYSEACKFAHHKEVGGCCHPVIRCGVSLLNRRMFIQLPSKLGSEAGVRLIQLNVLVTKLGFLFGTHRHTPEIGSTMCCGTESRLEVAGRVL